jgi:ABC-type branched-subunit amino acid transport system substrate-binding protein
VHAPVTGAAPLPVTSFERARDLYFRYLLEQQEDIGGFTSINISFADDRYQPSTAVQACRQLAASNFLLVGAGGTDQIQACGRFADQSGIPYFSAGVTEAGLAGLRNYFSFSMTYKQQGFLLAQYVKANFAGQRVAAIVTETENFNDAVQGWEAGVQQAGLDYAGTLRHPKGDNSWYNTFANQLAQDGVEVVYINSAPVDYIRFAQQAAQQGFTPQFVGVGVTMGLNAVLGSGCPEVDGGRFFSPFPGLDWARQNEPTFEQAADQFGTPKDDIAFALWAQGKILAQLLEGYEQRYGSNDLTREDFRDFVETQSIQSGIFPDLQYSAQNHFGASQVHVLQADCGSGEHKTLATFATGF